MKKPLFWKVYIAFSYPTELLDADQMSALKKTELWMYAPEISHLPDSDEDMLAVLRLPAANPEAAIKIGLYELDQALLRQNLPLTTTHDTHVQPVRSVIQ